MTTVLQLCLLQQYYSCTSPSCFVGVHSFGFETLLFFTCTIPPASVVRRRLMSHKNVIFSPPPSRYYFAVKFCAVMLLPSDKSSKTFKPLTVIYLNYSFSLKLGLTSSVTCKAIEILVFWMEFHLAVHSQVTKIKGIIFRRHNLCLPITSIDLRPSVHASFDNTDFPLHFKVLVAGWVKEC